MLLRQRFSIGLISFLILLSSTVGCVGDESSKEDPIRIAYKVKDDYENPDQNPQTLADFLSEQLDRSVEVYPISNDGAAIEALRFGHADLAFLDGGAAWVAWKQHGIEAIVADQKIDGSAHYTAAAWVRNDSDIQSLEDLAGRNSCHTGWLKSAGMLMPMGYMIGAGMVDVSGNSSDIESLRTTIENHFENASIPASGDLYYGYVGAFRCMTEGGGDVAFVKTTSYEDHCTGEVWCLNRSAYRMLEPPFGMIPTHPVMVNPNLEAQTVADLQKALLALNSDANGSVILEDVLETPGLVKVTTEGHLGSYSSAISNIPGIITYFDEKYNA